MNREIILDATVLRPPYSGVHRAVQAQARHLLPLLVSRGYSPCLATLDAELLNLVAATPGASPFRPPRATLRPACRILWQQTLLKWRLRSAQPDLFYGLAYTLPLPCPVPALLNVHDLIALEHPELCSWTNRLHMNLLLAPSIRAARLNLVSATAVASQLQKRLDIPASRIAVNPLGVEFETFAKPTILPPELQKLAAKPYLLFVSNLEPKKGIGVLLQAYAKVAEKCRIDLVIAGRPAWKCQADVAAIQNWRQPGQIHLLGSVPDAWLPALYQQAAAFVFPSLAEGFGLPVLEAMAAGTPVIHSDHPVIRETAGNAGLAFRTGDASDLVDKIGKLLESPALRQELVAAGKARAQGLSWQRWAARTLDLIATVE
jgi:glycosyltransferase involved in cell wall biosynthesis